MTRPAAQTLTTEQHPPGVPCPWQFELAAAIHQSLLAAITGPRGRAGAPARPPGRYLIRPSGPLRVFRGTADQVAAVGRFARAQANDHPAATDAVLVASQLAASAIARSAADPEPGLFLVHVTAVSPDHIAVLVTSHGSDHDPRSPHAATTQAGSGHAIIGARSARTHPSAWVEAGPLISAGLPSCPRLGAR